jgi:hypothetical protein
MRRSHKRRVLQRRHPFRGLREPYKTRHERLRRLLQTAQEDNATLEALLRATVAGLIDFARITVMRTASDTDRPYPGQVADEPVLGEPGRFRACAAEYLSGRDQGRAGDFGEWNSTFAADVNATNYFWDFGRDAGFWIWQCF